jgi:hypothetical protein
MESIKSWNDKRGKAGNQAHRAKSVKGDVKPYFLPAPLKAPELSTTLAAYSSYVEVYRLYRETLDAFRNGRSVTRRRQAKSPQQRGSSTTDIAPPSLRSDPQPTTFKVGGQSQGKTAAKATKADLSVEAKKVKEARRVAKRTRKQARRKDRRGSVKATERAERAAAKFERRGNAEEAKKSSKVSQAGASPAPKPSIQPGYRKLSPSALLRQQVRAKFFKMDKAKRTKAGYKTALTLAYDANQNRNDAAAARRAAASKVKSELERSRAEKKGPKASTSEGVRGKGPVPAEVVTRNTPAKEVTVTKAPAVVVKRPTRPVAERLPAGAIRGARDDIWVRNPCAAKAEHDFAGVGPPQSGVFAGRRCRACAQMEYVLKD